MNGLLASAALSEQLHKYSETDACRLSAQLTAGGDQEEVAHRLRPLRVLTT
jgi:hypothetical protein